MSGLSDPLVVKGYTLKNRIVMPPMNTGSSTIRGEVTDSLIKHYTRHSKSLGLLIVEHAYISLDGKYSTNQLGIYDNHLIPGLKQLTNSVHANNVPIILQINHKGARSFIDVARLEPHIPPLIKGTKELSIKEIENIVENFAIAAGRAIDAGFDGVEIHGAHGYLLNQFSSSLTNTREDLYGGSLSNRIRFPLELIRRVKEEIKEKLLLYRLGSVDLDPKGTNIKDSQQFALKMEEIGVDIIDVSGGMCGHLPNKLVNKQGFFIPQAEKIKKILKIPVIGVGGITDPFYADRLVQEERVDLVAVGRELLKDPDWPLKALNRLNRG